VRVDPHGLGELVRDVDMLALESLYDHGRTRLVRVSYDRSLA